MTEQTRRWAVGELATASGVSVRTLHYYDEIGLVSPGERSPAGHRRYRDQDVRRLYRVLSLSRLGLTLDEIATTLDDTANELDTLRDLLTGQLAALDQQATRLDEVRARVRGLLELLDSGTFPEPERFLSTLEPLVMPTPPAEQRAQASARATDLGEHRVTQLKNDWLALLAQLRQHQQDATPVDDPEVQRLVRRWNELGAELNPDSDTSAVDAFWQRNQTSLSAQLGARLGWDDPNGVADVVAYVRRARG